MNGRPAAVSVRIRRLVVDGVSPADRQQVAEGVHARLVEAVTEWVESGAAAGWAPPRSRRGVVSVALTRGADDPPSELGRSIGTAMAGVVFEVER